MCIPSLSFDGINAVATATCIPSLSFDGINPVANRVNSPQGESELPRFVSVIAVSSFSTAACKHSRASRILPAS